jgi:hypothetical protein
VAFLVERRAGDVASVTGPFYCRKSSGSVYYSTLQGRYHRTFRQVAPEFPCIISAVTPVTPPALCGVTGISYIYQRSNTGNIDNT